MITAAYIETKTDREGNEFFEVTIYFDGEKSVEHVFTDYDRAAAINKAEAAFPEIVAQDIEFEDI